jgi:ABC-2 type transport system ATP-binding protein
VNSIVVEGLYVRYGAVEAVRGASLSVAAGEIFGLLGPNGAGKSSLLRVLTTLGRQNYGRASVLGHDVEREPEAVRRVIGYVPQALSADGSLTGKENARLFAHLYNLSRARSRARVDEVLEVMGIAPAADDLVRTYSGGMVRRLEIACALLNLPRVLMLDEPTIGLDPVARRSLWRYLRELQAENGMTMLITTHYLHEAEEHCERVAVMSAGRVVAEGKPDEVRATIGSSAGNLEDAFVALSEAEPGAATETKGGLDDISRVRRTARRLG